MLRAITDRSACRKHSNKIVIAGSAKAGNGTVTQAAMPLKDTEYYQVNMTGDYVQEPH